LRYRELAVTEPIVDLQRILGEGGIAGKTSAIMNLRLKELQRATSWNEIQDRTREVHRLAHDELPVIPLWQTVNHFAYRDWLQGLGKEPLALYQDVREWRKSFDEGGQ
jgi:ABC-type oligopeptide transport system substrate-binding subunit